MPRFPDLKIFASMRAPACEAFDKRCWMSLRFAGLCLQGIKEAEEEEQGRGRGGCYSVKKYHIPAFLWCCALSLTG